MHTGRPGRETPLPPPYWVGARPAGLGAGHPLGSDGERFLCFREEWRLATVGWRSHGLTAVDVAIRRAALWHDAQLRMDAQAARSERAQQGADDEGSGSPPRKWRMVPRAEGSEVIGCPRPVARVGSTLPARA